MAIVCDDLKLIYFLAPGTGSSAVSQFFIDNFNGQKVPDSENNIFSEDGKFLMRGKHSTYDQLVKNNLLNSEQKKYLRVTGIRNPFDYYYGEWYRSRNRFSKMLADQSSWIYKSEDGHTKIKDIVNSLTMDFSEWLEHKFKQKYAQKKQLLLHTQYVEQADSFIKMENANQDIKNILVKNCGVAEKTKIEVPKKNYTDRDRCYWKHYNQKSRDMITYIYQPYLNKFDYSF